MDHQAIFFVEVLFTKSIGQSCDGSELFCHGLGEFFGHDRVGWLGGDIFADQATEEHPIGAMRILTVQGARGIDLTVWFTATNSRWSVTTSCPCRR